MMSCHLWVLSEEVAKLFLKTRSRRSPKKLLESSILVYLSGLGLILEN